MSSEIKPAKKVKANGKPAANRVGNPPKPRVAVFKFASCDGCQLSLLDAEDELLAITDAVEIAYFLEASRAMAKGPYDIGLVEGSITTHDDGERIQQVRRECKRLITIGACATAGGIQALRNWKDLDESQEYEPPFAARVEAPNRAGVGQAITEAPRGILYHRYAIDEKGLILTAKIVPPTSQNQKRIEEDLRAFAPRLARSPLKDATWKCEQAIRNYDPCISCATHFLKLTVEREEDQ